MLIGNIKYNTQCLNVAWLTMVGVPQLPTNHTSISGVPVIIAHSAPVVI